MEEHRDRSALSRAVCWLARQLVALAGVVGRVLVLTFGKLHWQPPTWLVAAGRGTLGTGSWARRHPLWALGVTSVALSGALVIGYSVHWYRHRPKPLEMEVTVAAPGLTKIEEHIRPEPLVLTFSGSAAPLAQIGKVVQSGVELTPPIEGTWRWESDSRLTFVPRADWPIGQELVVALQRKGLVADTVRLAGYRLPFRTEPFSASIAETQFYQDPVDPDMRKVVATLKLSHPVDTAELERRVRLFMEDKESQLFKFNVIYDRFKVQAHVHSEPVPIPEKDMHLIVSVDPGVVAARGGPPTEKRLTYRVRIPGRFDYMRIQSAQLTIADNDRFEPVQILVLESNLGIREREMREALRAYVLPLYHPDHEKLPPKQRRPHAWNDVTQIGPEILRRSTPMKLEPIPADREHGTTHSFRVHAEVGRTVYVLVRKGLRSFGGYVLGKPFDALARVPEFPKRLRFLHSGALLSLSGEKKLSVFARDVEGIRFEIGRVLPDQLQHVVAAVGRGHFTNPYFGYQLSEDSLTELFSEVRGLPKLAPGKGQYEVLDLSKYLQPVAGRRQGLFLIKAESYDPQRKVSTGESDQRLILVTDLGLLVKDAADGTHDVFVQSLATGKPVAGARVEVVGRNGLPVLGVTTDGEGHGKLPSLAGRGRDKTPSFYLARLGNDLSFLPYGTGYGERYLNLSRFDVGGVVASAAPQGLTAYLFSDRGIYRPGDELHVGLIVKSADWRQSLKGVPLEAVITDPRGLTVKKEKLRLGPAGFEEIRHATLETSPTGTYSVNVYIIKDEQQRNLLGSTSVRVQEFLPDRMKIRARLSAESPDGWVRPAGLRGHVSLQNLFGTPAAGRRVRGALQLSPALPTLGKQRGFRFHDPLAAKQSFDEKLQEAKTDDKGEATFELDLKRFADATYRLRFIAEGFEAEGGRSVVSERYAVISPLAFLVGYKADGDLRYVSKGSKRRVELIAVGPQGTRVAAPNLKAVLLERRYVSVLTRQSNGTYKYESVRKETLVSDKELSIPAQGLRHALPTGKPGDFVLVLRDRKDTELNRVEFSIAGQGNLTRSLDKDAELQLTLEKTDVAPGGELRMQIKAPYAGAGLITVERDRVYAHRWFKSDMNATVQSIRLPADFEGNGYVSVSFIRDVSSDEVYMSPLSYGVAPFSVSRERRMAKVKLTSPETARPGDAYRIRYRTDRPARLVVVAIDEGILQVARYRTPDPLGHFFQKRALEVRTAQILDLILPELRKLMNEASAPGGDGEEDRGALGANLNPFKRRRDKPVAFWSGLLDAGPRDREVSYTIPDSFNGTLRVMAVAVAADGLGVFEKRVQVRGDFVISPNVPTFVAPGDELEVSVAVANNVEGSGTGASIALELRATEHLEVVGPTKVTLSIDELREASASFRLRARPRLGSATLTFVAALGARSSKLATDLSVRPAAPYLTTLDVGHVRAGEARVALRRRLYPEHRTLRAGISTLPLGLAPALVSYLEKFPHGCTEQLVSQAVPAVALRGREELGMAANKAERTLASIVAQLRARQNDEGAFGLWAANPHISEFASVYALHVLLEAKERGFAVPPEVITHGLAYLKGLAAHDGSDLADERLRAYAIYVLTRGGTMASSLAMGLQKRLEQRHAKTWRKDLAGVYLAATFKLLRQERLAEGLIGHAVFGEQRPDDYVNYDDALIHDAQLLYVLARHFPRRASQMSAAALTALVERIRQGRYNTLSSAYTILALEAYGQTARSQGGSLSIVEHLAGGQRRALRLSAGLFPQSDFADQAQGLSFASSGGFEAFYQVTQAGFDLQLPAQPIKEKLEVHREYVSVGGKPVDRVKLGDELEVHVRLRALTKHALPSLAIVDLLPGGFEPVAQSTRSRTLSRDEDVGDDEERSDQRDDEPDDSGGSGFSLPIGMARSSFQPEYGDVREDRVVLYGTAEPRATEYVYVIKATNPGIYAVPPIKAESLYDRTIVAQSVGGKIVIEKQ